MDSLTHTLTALALRRLLPRGWTAGRASPGDRLDKISLPLTLALAANAPDLDLLFALAGGTTYLEQNRAASHSLLGAAVLGSAAGLLVWRWRRRRRGSAAPLPWNVFVLMGIGGGWSHTLLDWLNPAGVQLLWPLHRAWYGLDWFSLIDPWVLIILLLGFALPALFRLVSEEIGARRTEAGPRWGAGLALAACVLLGVGRATWHAEAVAELDSRQFRNRAPIRVGAFPGPIHPWRWHGVVETESSFELVEVTQLGPDPGLKPGTTHYKPETSPALEAALAQPSARAFLEWARFPLATVTPTVDGWRVSLRDLRYAREAPGLGVFTLEIEVSKGFTVEGERVRLERR